MKDAFELEQDIAIDEPIVSQEAFDAIQAESTTKESLAAMFRLSQMDATTQSIAQYREIDDAEKRGGERIPVAKLNELYPDLATPFTEPKSKEVADIIAARQRRRQELGEVIANGPQGSLMGVARFGTALVPHAIDPVNVGSGLAISALTAGAGVVKNIGQAVQGARAAGAALEAVQAARTATVVGRALSNPFIRHFGEGVIGNVASETLVARAAIQEGREYNLDDAFYNTVGGAMLVPGVIWGGQKAIQGLRYTGRFAINRTAEYLGRIDPKYSEVIQATSLARLLNDKRPVPGVFHEHAVAELSGNTPRWTKQEYAYSRITPETMAGKPIYAASYDQGMIGEVATESFDHYLGDAVYVTDDPRVANGAAGRGFKEGNGRVLQLEADQLNLIDLNEKVPENLKDLFRELGINKADLEKLKVADIMTRFQDELQSNQRDPDFIDSVNARLKEKGYDGYISDGANVEGMPRDPHNSMIVFNKEKLREVGEIEPDLDAVGSLPPERLKALEDEAMSEISQFAHDDPDSLLRDWENTPREPIKKPELKDLEADELVLSEQLADLQKQDLLDADEIKVVEEVKAAQRDAETLTTMLKYAAACVGLD